MGDENENIGCIPDMANAISKAEVYDRMCAEREKMFLRGNSMVIYELALERRELCENILNLTNAIKVNPVEVSFEHKALWREQHNAMLAYKNALDKRIVNLIKESGNEYALDAEPEKI